MGPLFVEWVQKDNPIANREHKNHCSMSLKNLTETKYYLKENDLRLIYF